MTERERINLLRCHIAAIETLARDAIFGSESERKKILQTIIKESQFVRNRDSELSSQVSG